MSRRDGRLAALLGALLLALSFAPLSDPASTLVARDILKFHLPLRASWAELAAAGAAQWDPFAHGGQPLVSNPNYGALYPPSWLALLLPAPIALAWMVLLHAALAAVGAARLARRLGADAWSALLAALAYTAGPTYLSLLHSLPLALGMSWLPWILAATLALVDAADVAARRRAALGLAFALALLVITGDPVMLAMTGIVLGAFVLFRFRRARSAAAWLAIACGLGAALASVQLLPALARLAESPRAGGLDFAQATRWSLPWPRVVELLFPRFFGDPTRPELALYFGWGIHDRDYPYLLLLDVSWPLLLLALAAWTRRSTPDRWPWLLAAAAGLALALGRHNPLNRVLFPLLPGLDQVRYPEKFFLLPLAAAIFTAAVAWRRLLDERDRGRPAAAELPAALAASFAGLALIFVGLTHGAPRLTEWFVRAHSGLPPGDLALARAQQLLRLESRVSLVLALGALALFAAARFTRVPRRALELAAVALVAGELAWYGRPLAATLPTDQVFTRPAILAVIDAANGRWYSDAGRLNEETEIVFTGGDAELAWARAPIDRLDPRIGNLFGASYALDLDYDLTLTPPAARAAALLARLDPASERGRRLLGAWSVRHLVHRRAAREMAEEYRLSGVAPRSAVHSENRQALAPVRFVAGASSFPDATAAEQAAIAAGLPLGSHEFLIGAGELPAGRLDRARLLAAEVRGADLAVELTAEAPALLVVATTFDRDWRARLDGAALPLYECAAGYLAALVPAGEHRLELAFRDRWFARGAWVTALALASALGLFLASRPRSRGEAAGRPAPASYNALDRAAP